MPKYLVKKGHDAWVKYGLLIDAPTAEIAEEIADRREFRTGAGWVELGEVDEFDHCEIMEGETEEVPADYVLEPPATPATCLILADEERNIVIAALRLWQQTIAPPLELQEIACDHGDSFLTNLQIDALIEEKINV